MKRIYKLLGYLLQGMSAYAVFDANNTDLQANSQRIMAVGSAAARGNRSIQIVLKMGKALVTAIWVADHWVLARAIASI